MSEQAPASGTAVQHRLKRTVERRFVPYRRLSSSPGLPCREPHVPRTGSELRVTVLAVWEPRQTLQLRDLGSRT